jgi:hypothetical protein
VEREIMNLKRVNTLIFNNAKKHSPLILTVAAGVGSIATSYFVARASFKASNLIREDELANGTIINPKKRVLHRTGLVWKLYIPPALSTVFTVGSMVVATKLGSKKVLAAQVALGASQQKLAEYTEKVVEEFGPRKDTAIKDKIAEDKIKNNPAPSQDVMMTGPGHVLTCELYTGRYFVCDMETLRRAQNTVNDKLLRHDYASLSDFYHLVGLKGTTTSSDIGWSSDKLMELTFTAVMADDGRPCIAFDYNYTKPV